MTTPDFFRIIEILDEVTYLHPSNETSVGFKTGTEADTKYRYLIDEGRLQASSSEEGWQEYGYFLRDSQQRLLPTARIHAYLQDSLESKDTDSGINQISFREYQEKTLRLLLGMYVFIDTTDTDSSDQSRQEPYYLLGPMKSKPLKPTFNFRFLETRSVHQTGVAPDKSIRAGEDTKFRDPDPKWLQFFLAYNEFTRDADSFTNQDFVRLFNYQNHKLKRASTLEKRHHVAYIRSGEMDHCILQYLALFINSTPSKADTGSFFQPKKQKKHGVRQIRTGFNLFTMSPGLQKFFNENKEFNAPNYRKSPSQLPTLETRRLEEWLQIWGLMVDGRPTVRMTKAMDWFAEYLESLKDKSWLGNYLNLVNRPGDSPDAQYFSSRQKAAAVYVQEWRKFKNASAARNKRDLSNKKTEEIDLLDSYLELIFSYSELDEHGVVIKNSWEQFAERCRFRPFVHFVFRYLTSAFKNQQAETSGRGLIVFPILSSYQNEQNSLHMARTKAKESDNIEYVGYFIGHVYEGYDKKDIQSLPDDNYLTQFKQIINYMGRIESERIYFKGIINTYQRNALKQAKLSAIASCMSRNLSHTTGSHKSPWFKNYWNIYLKELRDFVSEGWSLPDYIKKGLLSLGKISEQSGPPNKTERMEGVKLIESHLLKYFDFVNDNMEFIADVTTAGDAKKVTFNYSVKEFYEEYQMLRLMHHGLFDDRKMEVHIDFDNSNLRGNQYDSADVSVPNGQLGKTAFYVILENVIRNFYKHSFKESNRPQFRLKISPDDGHTGEYWAVDFFDVVKKKKNIEARDEALLQRINNNFINRSITGPNGTLRPEGWGYIEMKACCAYLINFPMHELDLQSKAGILEAEHETYHPLLEANYYNDSGKIITDYAAHPGNRNLGYRFYLKRAQKIGIHKDFNIKTSRPTGMALKPFLTKAANSGIIPLDDQHFAVARSFELCVANNRPAAIDANQRCLLAADPFDPWSGDTLDQIEENCWNAFIAQSYPAFDKDFHIASTKEELSALVRKNVPKSKIVFIDDHARVGNQKKYSAADLADFLWYLPDELRTWRDIKLIREAQTNIYSKDRLIEVLNTGVAIFDERIQQETLINYSNNPGIIFKDIHRCAGIFIPDDQFDLSSESIIPLLEKEIARQFRQVDYVILHFTLFEKMVEHYNNLSSPKKKLSTYYTELVQRLKLEEQGKVLVFCSGRGRPSNLFSNCYYIHLSTLQYFTIRTISKYSLVNILRSLRQT